MFEKASISYGGLKKIKEEIDEKIEKEQGKYPFVTFCGLMSNGISIGVSKGTAQTDIDKLMEDLSDYKEYISLSDAETAASYD